MTKRQLTRGSRSEMDWAGDGRRNEMKTPNEEKIVRMRFGIGFDREHTLEEIAQDFGVTRERIRQIETQALQRLRGAETARRLRPLMSIQ